MKNTLKNKEIAIALRDSIIKKGYISDLTCYDDALANAALMGAILSELVLHLSKSKKDSIYGQKIISDIQLWLKAKTDKDLQELLKDLNIDIKIFNAIKKDRNLLYQSLMRTRKNLIYDMDLVATPINKSKTSKKRTIEDVRNEKAKQEETARAIQVKKNASLNGVVSSSSNATSKYILYYIILIKIICVII